MTGFLLFCLVPELLGGCAVGQVKITGGYQLPAEFVIHTVGPVWQGGEHEEEINDSQGWKEAIRQGLPIQIPPALSSYKLIVLL